MTGLEQIIGEGTENLLSIFSLTKHAALRIAQRNISLSDLDYVLEHGERIYKTGITMYILRKIDIPPGDGNKSQFTRLEGTVLLVGLSKNGNPEIITAYRNRNALKELRRKGKYDNRWQYRTHSKAP